ncbi:excinuclease ABC subunit C [Mycobacteroides abscessus subsp. abscessus]|nr:excinuclease ABC subunit C [Mycobacteroides abscessus subsp. abscessus]
MPGLGEVRRKALVTYFGSMKKLRTASADDIAQVPGFGPTLAMAVHDALADQSPGMALNTATGELIET